MNIPECVFSKIMLYNSHPVADVFQNEFTEVLHKIKTYYDDDDGDLFYSMWQNQRTNINYKIENGDDDEDEFPNDATEWD